MKKLNFLITSGATKEYIDPVRYITNASSGTMGSALAEAAIKTGAKITFIAGTGSARRPRGKCKIINVISAVDMFNAVKDNLKKNDILIFAAAVGDFRPKQKQKQKIKGKMPPIAFVKNPDIAAYAGKHKKGKVSVCFALETDNFLNNARAKLKNKNADFIVLNTAKTIGAKTTDGKIVFPDGAFKNLPKTKISAARKIINEAIKLL